MNCYLKLASEAVTRYNLRNARVTLLHVGFVNVFFRIEAESPESHQLRQYVCRIHGHGCSYSTAAIESELRWLLALRRDTSLVVPEPVFARDGSLVQEIAAPGMGKRKCVLLGWVEGEFINDGLTPSHLRQVGVFAAHLHEHALMFAESNQVVRPKMDWNRRKQLLSPWLSCDIKEKTILSESELQLFQRAAEGVLLELYGIEADENFGLIHGDFSQRNYLFHQGSVRAIDFDSCCFSHHLSELAATLYWLEELGERKHLSALRDALLSGYQSVRPLPEGYLRQLDVFQTATHLFIYKGLANSAASANHDSQWRAKFLPNAMNKCQRYLSSNRREN